MKQLLHILLICLSIPVVAQVPVITAVTPIKGAVGDTITITGRNFSATTAGNTVSIGGIKATIVSASTTVLKAKIPAGMTTDPVSVACNNLQAWSDVRITCTIKGTNRQFSEASFADRLEMVGSSTATLADMNNDGKLDLLYRTGWGMEIAINTSTVGKISFATPVLYKMDALGSITVVDLDGDGWLDVASVAVPGDHFVVFRNNGTNLNDTIHVPLEADAQGYKLVAADNENSGKADLYICSLSAKVVVKYKNKSTPGHMAFQRWTLYNNNIGITPWNMEFADFNGDGTKDMALTGYGPYMQIFRNSSISEPYNIDLTDMVNMPSTFNTNSVDMDHDGKQDLVISTGATKNVGIFMNRPLYGAMAFASPVYVPTEVSADWVSVDDMDGDGELDLVTNDYWNSAMSVYKNTGDSSHVKFAAPVKYELFANAYGYNYKNMTGDLDGDGKPEIIACQTGERFYIFRNTVGGTTDVHICPGMDTTLVTSLTSSTYQWQVDMGNGYQDITVNGNSAELTLRNVQATSQGYLYRCMVDSGYDKIFKLQVGAGAIPVIRISSDLNNVCENALVRFTATYEGAGERPAFRWLLNGVSTDSTGLTYTSSELKDQDKVSAVVYSSAGCTQALTDTSNVITMNVRQGILPVLHLSTKDSLLVKIDTLHVRAGSWLTLYRSYNGAAFAPYRDLGGVDTGKLSFTISKPDSIVAYYVLLRGYSVDGCALLVHSDTITIGGVPVVPVIPEDTLSAPAPAEPHGKLYPNPVSTNLMVDELNVNDGWVTMEIRSIDGMQNLGVYNVEGKTNLNINIATLNKGYYLAVLKRKSGPPKTIRFIKL